MGTNAYVQLLEGVRPFDEQQSSEYCNFNSNTGPDENLKVSCVIDNQEIVSMGRGRGPGSKLLKVTYTMKWESRKINVKKNNPGLDYYKSVNKPNSLKDLCDKLSNCEKAMEADIMSSKPSLSFKPSWTPSSIPTLQPSGTQTPSRTSFEPTEILSSSPSVSSTFRPSIHPSTAFTFQPT